MWINKDNNDDPYNRGNVAGKTIDAPNVGSGAGGGAPIGAGEGNQTNSTPSTLNPVSQVPQTKSATVQDYLSANKEQGNQLGQQFQGKLEDTAKKDRAAIDSAASTVKNQAQAATTAYDPTIVNKAVNDPTSVANNPNNLNSFLKQWNAEYTGPASFEATEDYNRANAASSDAQTHATEVADAGGRKQILQDDFGVYGQGNKGLDHTLLQNSDNFGAVLNTGKELSTIPGYLNSKAADVNATATKAASDTAATKKNTHDLFQNSLTNFQTDLTNRVSSDKQAAVTSTNQIKSDLATGDVAKIAEDLKKSNLSSADRTSIQNYLTTLNSTYGVKPDLNNYYTYNPATDVNAATVASKDDFAKAQALQKLTGVDYSGVLNPADVSKAGTWNNAGTGYQGASLQSFLKNSVAQQDKELLAKSDLNDLSAKMNLPSIVDPKNFGNADLGSKAAQSLITIAQRNGMGRGKNGTPNNLDNLYHQAAVSLVGTAGGGALNTNNPAIAGLLTFVRQLGTYLYGKPQY